MELLGKSKEKQKVQIRVKAQHSKITQQSFHEVNNHKINRAAKCHCSSQLKRIDQCSMQINNLINYIYQVYATRHHTFISYGLLAPNIC
jgi:hypothetical protein